MAIHDYVIANQNGANTRSDLNNALAAIVSNNSSATEPSTTYAFMWWADTASDILKQRNAADSAWINILTLSTGAPLGALAASLVSGTHTNFTSTGIDDNATSTAITIDSGERVGIGATAQADYGAGFNQLVIGDGTAVTQGLTIATTAAGYGGIAFADGTGSSEEGVGHIRYAHTTDDMYFVTADAERMRITSDGRGLSQFTAKAWANFDGTGAITIRDSHNISSIADGGTGQYTISFTNALANANHATVASLSKDGASPSDSVSNYASVAELSSTTICYIECMNHAHARQDVANIGVITFGD